MCLEFGFRGKTDYDGLAVLDFFLVKDTDFVDFYILVDIFIYPVFCLC